MVYVSAHRGYRDMKIISQIRRLQLCLNKKGESIVFVFRLLLVDTFASVECKTRSSFGRKNIRSVDKYHTPHRMSLSPVLRKSLSAQTNSRHNTKEADKENRNRSCFLRLNLAVAPAKDPEKEACLEWERRQIRSDRTAPERKPQFYLSFF